MHVREIRRHSHEHPHQTGRLSREEEEGPMMDAI